MLTLAFGVLIGAVGLALLPDDFRDRVVSSVKSLKQSTVKLLEDRSKNNNDLKFN